MDSPVEEKLSKNALKRKYKAPSIEEDPNQFHAKPKDLSLNAADMPEQSTETKRTEHIFTRTPFSSFSLEPKLVGVLESPLSQSGFNIKSCTNVQGVVIPTLLEKRRNILLKSQTGSGKTLSYLIPIVNDLMKLGAKAVSRNDGSRALIVAPTRELCSQIAEVLAKITQCCVWIVGGSITGGEKKKSEKARLRKGVVILVATPGRLLDHVKTTESFNLTKLRWIVLDEADRLLDMGFEQSVLEILSHIRGVALPGLKQQPARGSTEEKRGVQNLQSKWTAQNSVLAKKCLHTHELVYLMASATLTKAVKLLALPIMSDTGFLVVDADAKSVVDITSASQLLSLDTSKAKKSGEEAQPTFTSFDDNDNEEEVEGAQEAAGKSKRDQEEKEESSSEDSDEEGSEQKGKAEDGRENKKSRFALEKGEQMEAPSQLAQYYMTVNCKWRLPALLSFLRTHSTQKVVVFFSTCDSVDYHALLLREMQWPVDLDAGFEEKGLTSKRKRSDGEEDEGFSTVSLSPNASQYLEPLESTFTGMLGKDCLLYRLHGNVPQKVRQNVYKDFCNARSGILLCTDVAARGLDLPAVDWILQYDPPCETTDYVHRIGRTARKGLVGSALLFLLPSEAAYVALLGSHGLVPEALALQSLLLNAATKHIPGAAKFKNVEEMAAVILQRRAETVVYNSKWLLSAGRQAFRSFVRAYATHSIDTKGIFQVQQLHLGHVTKTFALRESPTALKNSDDVIGKIFNGVYSIKSAAATMELTAKEKAQARADKYGLANKAKKAKTGGGGREPPKEPTKGFMTAHLKKGRDRQKLRKMGSGSTGGNTENVGGKNAQPTVSGKFRKTEGYFRKKLRAQLTSEFER